MFFYSETTGIVTVPITLLANTSSLYLTDACVGTSSQITFTVSSSGNATETVYLNDDSNQFSFSPSNFIMSGGVTSQVVTVTFTPTKPWGLKSGNLTLSSSGGSLLTLAMSGNAVAVPLMLTSSVNSVNFSDILLNSSSSQTFTVSAGGFSSVEETVTISDNSSQFDFSPSSFSLTGSGVSQTVTAIFNPSSLGVKTAVLNLSASGGSTKIISLQGNAVEQYKSSTVLLLKGDSTNNKNNNIFLDSGPLNLSMTRNGTPTQGSFTPFSTQIGNWSTYHPESSGIYSNTFFVNGTTTSANMGTNFTLEFWFKGTASSLQGRIVSKSRLNTDSGDSWYSGIDEINGKFYFSIYYGVTAVRSYKFFTSTSRLDDEKWHHCAFVKEGTTYKIFVDGNLESSEVFATALSQGNACNVTVGGTTINAGTGGDYGRTNCSLSNVRITNTAVYTSAFTPSTTPLTAISGTVLLVCQDNTLKDNGPNSYSCTVQKGTPTAYPIGPFIDTNPVSISELGSGYFNGTTDYLSLADNSAWTFTGDFTVEAWINPKSISGIQTIVAHWPGAVATNCSFGFGITAAGKLFGDYGIGSSNLGVVGNTTISANTWTHVAMSRTGTTFKLFVNGVVDNTATISGAYNNSTGNLTIGCRNTTDKQYFNGNISNLRIVNGTGIYTGSFTVPTSAVTSVANTKLLTNFTNAGVVDSTKNITFSTVGTAKISTTQSKFGSSSINFNGTTDYLSANDPNLNLESCYTVEAWVYPNSYGDITNGSGLFFNGTTTSNVNRVQLALGGTGAVVGNGFLSSGTAAWQMGTSAGAVPLNSWTHIALSSDGSIVRIFVNGNLAVSGSISPIYTLPNNFYIGFHRSANILRYFNGYIDDFRVTKGIARYTSNFAPPTAL